MATYTESDSRSIGQIVKDLTADLSALFRSEIALLKLEIKDTFAKLGGGVALIAGALFLTLAGTAFLFVTIILSLVALGVPPLMLTLSATVVLFTGATVLGILGKKKLEGVNFVPNESIEQIKSDIDTIKADFERVRSR